MKAQTTGIITSAVRNSSFHECCICLSAITSYDSLFSINFSAEALNALQKIEHRARQCAVNPININVMVKSNMETEIEDWFKGYKLNNVCELSPYLVEQGIDTATLMDYYNLFSGDSFNIVLQWAAGIFQVYTFLNEIKQGSKRIRIMRIKAI